MHEVTSSAKRIITVTMPEESARLLIAVIENKVGEQNDAMQSLARSLRTTLGIGPGPGFPRGRGAVVSPDQIPDARRGFEPGYAPRNENPSVAPPRRSDAPDGIERDGQFDR